MARATAAPLFDSLAAELGRSPETKLYRTTLMRTPSTSEFLMVVGATADMLAKSIECELRGIPPTEEIDARDSVQWEATMFALNVLDRWSLSRLGFAGRELVMRGVQAAFTEKLKEETAEAARLGYNECQATYENYAKLFADDGEPLKGTFCWEFAKGLLGKLAPDRLEKLPIFAVATASATVLLFKSCDQIAEG